MYNSINKPVSLYIYRVYMKTVNDFTKYCKSANCKSAPASEDVVNYTSRPPLNYTDRRNT